MLRVSDLLLEYRDISTFDELLDAVRQRAPGEMFFSMDLKPPYFDTPLDWEVKLEAAFTDFQRAPMRDASESPDNPGKAENGQPEA